MARPQHSINLMGKNPLSPNTIEMEFQLNDDTPFNFQAGQFIQLHFEHKNKSYKRSYSISNSPEAFNTTGTLQIAISFVTGGASSSFFNDATIGDQMFLSGPFGILTLPESIPKQLILVGTGTGIAPYRAMSPKLAKIASPSQKITILMGGRYQSNIIYRDDFLQLAKHPHINYKVCLSRENKDNLNEGEYTGYVQHQFENLDLDSDKDIVYLCGNPSMVDTATTQLLEMLFESKQIKREKYVFSGH